jgi:hypothetical protein
MKTFFFAIGGFLGLICSFFAIENAYATPYEYGVALNQYTGYGVPNHEAQWNQPCSSSTLISGCTVVPPNGNLSTMNSQNNGGSGTFSGGGTPGLSGSASETNTAKVDLGAIHLSSSSTATGDAGGQAFNQAAWVDVLTVGNNFASGTALQFAVNLDLSGYVDSSVQKGNNGSQSSASALVKSQFIVLPSPSDPTSINMILSGAWDGGDIFGMGGYQNYQQICLDQNNTLCGKGYQTFPKNFSFVLTTYPGATYIVEDVLTSTVSSNGNYIENIGGGGISYTYLTSNADSYFMDTSLFTMTPITVGAFYTSASGTSYMSTPLASTPEPASFWLMATGFLGLVGWIRYRQGPVPS